MVNEILKEHWETTKLSNQNLIIQNKIQIALAEEVIKLCDRKVKEFPKVE